MESFYVYVVIKETPYGDQVIGVYQDKAEADIKVNIIKNEGPFHFCCPPKVSIVREIMDYNPNKY